MFDPNEAHNLVEAASCRPVLEDMRERLDRWMEETDDPLLHGPLTPPVRGRPERARPALPLGTDHPDGLTARKHDSSGAAVSARERPACAPSRD